MWPLQWNVKVLVTEQPIEGVAETREAGTPQYINGISYWVPDTVTGQRVVEATIE